MTATFGDADPEDAWDPDDPLAHLVDNIVRRVALVVALKALDARAQQRLDLIERDLRHVADRILDEVT